MNIRPYRFLAAAVRIVRTVRRRQPATETCALTIPFVLGAPSRCNGGVVGAIALLVLRPRAPAPVATAEQRVAADAASAAIAKTDSAPAEKPNETDDGPPDSTAEELPGGEPAPKLPADAPSSVRFGVILFRYRGAQYAGGETRSKPEALALAEATLKEAEKDFAEAVKKGDPGSTGDAGRLPRGILEAPIEYVLFTMQPGTVYREPVDTPRGYWVVRRNK